MTKMAARIAINDNINPARYTGTPASGLAKRPGTQMHKLRK